VLYCEKDPTEDLINHEQVHLSQIQKDGVLKFYFNYLKEYFHGRRQGLSHYKAYRNISYEKEAFGDE